MRQALRFAGYSICFFGLCAGAAGGCVVKTTPSSTASGGSSSSGATVTNGTPVSTSTAVGASVGGSSSYTASGVGGAGGATVAVGTGGAGTGGASANASTGSQFGSGGAAPLTCAAQAGDGACDTCEKTACCTQITACSDAACARAHNDFIACRYDDQGVETGFSVEYCKQAVGADAATNAAASALVDCFEAGCTNGADPAAACALTSQAAPTFDNFAAKFIEDNCAGCHFAGFTAPSGQALTVFNDDPTWFDWNAMNQDDPGGPPPPVPEGNPSWRSHLDNQFNAIIDRKQIIYCGVNPDVLPDGCDPIVDAKGILPSDAFHNHPAKFPPSGMGTDHFGKPNPCKFADDANPPLVALGNQTASADMSVLVVTGTCPQPTHFDRARMASWIVDGVPKQ